MTQTTCQMPYQFVGEEKDPMSYAGVVHNIAGQNKERHSHERKRIRSGEQTLRNKFQRQIVRKHIDNRTDQQCKCDWNFEQQEGDECSDQ